MAATHFTPAARQQNAKGRHPELPAFILERNGRALAAGLTIEKQEFLNGQLNTWYGGTEKQWRVTPFCLRKKDRPFPRITTNDSACSCFSPLSFGGRAAFALARKANSDQYRGKILSEKIPEWQEDLGDGITAYGGYPEPNRPRSVIYIGPENALLERGIASPLVVDNHWEHASHGTSINKGPVIAEYQEMCDGRGWLCDFVDVREEALREEAEQNKHDFGKGSDLASLWAEMVRTTAESFATTYQRSESKAGKIFTISQASLEDIDEALDDLVGAILQANISVKDADPLAAAKKQRFGVARSDHTFQEFLAALTAVH